MATLSHACNLAVSEDITNLLSIFVEFSNFSVPSDASKNPIVTSQDSCKLTVSTSIPRNLVVTISLTNASNANWTTPTLLNYYNY